MALSAHAIGGAASSTRHEATVKPGAGGGPKRGAVGLDHRFLSWFRFERNSEALEALRPL